MNQKPKILFIDDEPDILLVVGLLLKSEGFEVETALNGKIALDMIASKTYDIVVSDYLMPGMDGIKVLKQVRGRKDYTPFVFFSGNADESHGLKMAGLGAYQLLPKTQVQDLAEVLRRTNKMNGELQQINFSKNETFDEFLEILHSA